VPDDLPRPGLEPDPNVGEDERAYIKEYRALLILKAGHSLEEIGDASSTRSTVLGASTG